VKWFDITMNEMVVAICKYQLESCNDILVQAIMPTETAGTKPYIDLYLSDEEGVLDEAGRNYSVCFGLKCFESQTAIDKTRRDYCTDAERLFVYDYILNCLRKEFGDDLNNVRDKILELRLKVLAEAGYKVVVPMSVNELLFGGE
jgi:hypothetical protein